ncbi:unnamed protein product, partial [Effrenium voratum]
ESASLLKCARAFTTPLLNLRDFSNRTVFDDLLHVARRVVPDLLASCLMDIFGKKSLGDAFEVAKLWCRIGRRERERSIDEFNVAFENDFPTLYAKGADCKVLVFWL